MIIKPATFVRMDIFEEKKVPIQVAEAPKRIKTMENPPIKKRAFNKTIRLSLPMRPASPVLVLTSSTDTPDMKEIYPGTSGSTQGDRNEIRPAANAINIETSSMLYVPF
jgi:hypothetical protein